ncbi:MULTISPECIES: type VI secretion system lipoprotein TssJ [Gammaproteobacteria]|uniref:Type VI secretion system lipoprotein TssJ n=1 Tax=Vreelandella halophila TaxID=86177 RepID=A0A9X4YA72_9GAMM|nr:MULTISPECIES: type VI secretion system lipoprotein TssJ [Gammaproteobacteria]KAA8982816.1 type VI secretion system lipoprotein TssJ [Halospina sp. K52047b]MYL26019.1 type VI secretion system lipoprotein TssJ [Halomonas utahensis]MYL73419.1 type VI secretion system lipoprotein TssJ [Halomonas sp. 22501_18_FS]
MRSGLILAMVLMLGGCAFFHPVADVRVTAGESVNPDSGERPSPVLLRVYELRSRDAFRDAGFDALHDDPEAALGEDLVGMEETMLRPGGSWQTERALQEGTRYLGVTAAFRNIDDARWRVTRPTDGIFFVPGIDLRVDGVEIRDRDD